MIVPFVDLKMQYASIKDEVDLKINTVLNETSFIGGSHVDQFEKAFAEKCGVKHCISVANGTDSLYIIMKMLGIGFGDEVITVVNSWISSSETISQTGATPVFVDIDPVYFSINEKMIESKITEKTKAILPVHLQGQMCDMDTILSIAKKYNLFVIEDCAQSHFSLYNNRIAGTMGTAGSFSFYPGKNIGAYGDAGCIITNDDDLAIKCRMYARHGALVKHQHKIEGINSRMDGIQAAVLSVKLKYIDLWNKKRNANALFYEKCLETIPQIVLPNTRPGTYHTFHLYVIRANRRAELISFLKDRGIETAIHYPTALHNMEAYRYLGYKELDFPVANEYQNTILSLPMFPELSSSQIEYISSSIKEFYTKSST